MFLGHICLWVMFVGVLLFVGYDFFMSLASYFANWGDWSVYLLAFVCYGLCHMFLGRICLWVMFVGVL